MTNNFNLYEIAKGEITKKIENELVKVINNIHDPHTEAGEKRSIRIELDFIPFNDREQVSLKSKVTSKLAKSTEVGATLKIKKDKFSNTFFMKEIDPKREKGQLQMDTDTGYVQDEEGEIVS